VFDLDQARRCFERRKLAGHGQRSTGYGIARELAAVGAGAGKGEE